MHAFLEGGYIESIGDIREEFPTQKLLETIEKLKPFDERKNMSSRMQTLVDGQGCARIAEELFRLGT